MVCIHSVITQRWSCSLVPVFKEHAPRANLGYGPVFHEDDAIGLINAARLGESDEEAVAFISSQRELKRVLIALGNQYRFVEHLCTDLIKV